LLWNSPLQPLISIHSVQAQTNKHEDLFVLQTMFDAYLSLPVIVKYAVDVRRYIHNVCVIFVDINPVNSHLVRLQHNTQ